MIATIYPQARTECLLYSVGPTKLNRDRWGFVDSVFGVTHYNGLSVDCGVSHEVYASLTINARESGKIC
jgi:hypothetical protein